MYVFKNFFTKKKKKTDNLFHCCFYIKKKVKYIHEFKF